MTAEQLALPVPKQRPKPPPEPDAWGLIVDEVLLNAIGSPARSWWVERGLRFEQSGKARIIDICIAGAIVELGPFERDDTEFLRDHMIENGVHPKVVKIRKWIADLPDCTRTTGPCIRCGKSHRRHMGGTRTTTAA